MRCPQCGSVPSGTNTNYMRRRDEKEICPKCGFTARAWQLEDEDLMKKVEKAQFSPETQERIEKMLKQGTKFDSIKMLEEELLECHAAISRISDEKRKMADALRSLGAWQDNNGAWAYGRMAVSFVSTVNGTTLTSTADKIPPSERQYWVVVAKSDNG